MATFDAGSIDARLTLDRSPFAEGLRLARAEADDFESDPINIGLDLADTAELARLREQIAALDGKRIRLDVDTTGSVELAHLRETLDTLSGKSIRLDVDIADAMLKIDRLRFSIDTLDAHANIDIDTATALEHLIAFRAEADALLAGIGGNVDLGRSGGSGGGGGNDSGGLFSGLGDSAPGLMLTAIATLGPIATAAVVPLTAAIGGFASALTSAGTGVGVLALGIVPTIKHFADLEKQLGTAETALSKTVPGTQQYADALAKVNAIQTTLNEQFGPMVVGLTSLTSIWHDFQDATRADSMGLIVQGMGIAGEILPRLLPIFNAFAPVVSEILTSMHNFMGGPEMARFLTFVQIDGPIALRLLVGIATNIGGVFVHLAEAFAPFSLVMLTGLDQMTQKWDSWSSHLGDTKGFQDFIDYATTQGPIMLQTLKDVAGALISIGEGMAPLAGPNMTAIRVLMETINMLPPDVITALAVGFEAWAVGMWAYTAATTAAAVATFALDVAASPILLAVAATIAVVILLAAAVVAIGIGIYELATKTQFFQTVWHAVWSAAQVVWEAFVTAFHATVDGLSTAWDAVVGALSAAWDAIVAATTAAWDAVTGAVSAAAGAVTGAVSAIVDGIVAVWNGFWGSAFGNMVQAAFDLVVAIFQLEFAILRFAFAWFVEGVKDAWGLVQDAFHLAGSVISTVMDAISSTIRSVWNAVAAFLGPILATIGSAISTAWNAIRSATSTVWNAISGVISDAWATIHGQVSAVVGAVQAVINAVWGAIRTATTSTWNAVRDAITGPLTTAKNAVSTAIDAIKGFFNGAETWLVDAGSKIVSGLIGGITSRIHDLTDAVGHLTSIITDHLPGSPVKTGPLRVLNDGYAGGQITAMIADGVSAKAHLVRQAVGDLADIAGMEIGGTGYINSRLGINQVTPQAGAGGAGSADQSAMLDEMQAMREATEEMTAEFRRQNDNLIVLARQGLLPAGMNR